jgi:hypothetical protein
MSQEPVVPTASVEEKRLKKEPHPFSVLGRLQGGDNERRVRLVISPDSHPTA